MSKRPGASGTSRRELLGMGLLGGAMAAAPLLGSERRGGAAEPGRGEAAAPSPGAAAPGFELEEATCASLQAAMSAGRLTARAITEAYLARIAALDRGGPGAPMLRAVLEVNPEAAATAEALDAERRERGPRGPLHGIPILLKDNIGTHDRMTTTAGSLALAGSVPARDAFVAARLRAAGAVLLGKANMSEWANFRSNRSSSGWSARGGQCRNPYALDRSPSGSSSGSAAATAANLCLAAVGSETDGSIVSPAGHCMLVGIKPTLGLLSRAGIIPIAHSQDTAGPLARTVTDAAILLGAMAGADPDDPWLPGYPAAAPGAGATGGPGTHGSYGPHGFRPPASADRATRAPAAGAGAVDYTRFLRADGLAGARLGVARRHYFNGGAADPVIEEAIAAMRRLGAEIVDPADLGTAGHVGDSEMEVLLYEFKADLDRHLAGLPAGGAAPVRSLAELIRFNEQHRAREMPFFGQELLVMAEAKGPLTDPAYRKALARNHRLTRQEGIDATLAKHRLDAILAPTGGPAWLIDLANGDAASGGSSTLPAVAGYPSITVPAGEVFGLPVGISFIGAAWSEPTLLRLAFAFEQATRHRRPPRFPPSAAFPAEGIAGAAETVA